MTFTFNKEELEYLQWLSGQLVELVATEDVDDFYWSCKVQKLRNKFTPNASAVYLTKTQRGMLLLVLTKRAQQVKTLVSSEATILNSVIEKVSK